MIGGIEKLEQQVAELAARNARILYELWASRMGSPIEVTFFIAISFLTDDNPQFMLHGSQAVGGGSPNLELFRKLAKDRGMLLIEYQTKELSWRADFVLSAPTWSDRKIIVECDGHEFHERTKQQAARDRSRDREAQAAGYSILRFTGAELYRDPMGCAVEAMKLLHSFAVGP